jgi:hypothetical protein
MNVQQPLWKRKIAQLAEYDIKHHASLLKWTTLIIWACSLVAEVGTFAANRKLPPKEKSFIIKQELTAGGISLAIMYLLADRFEKWGERLVNRGKLLPRELPQKWRNAAAVQKILKADPEFLKQECLGNKAWIEKLTGFRKGVSVLAGTIGTIIAFNITTPLISNKIASYFQNRSLAQKMSQGNASPLNPPVNPVNPAPPVPAPMTAPMRLQSTPTMPYYRYSPFGAATSFYR